LPQNCVDDRTQTYSTMALPDRKAIEKLLLLVLNLLAAQATNRSGDGARSHDGDDEVVLLQNRLDLKVRPDVIQPHDNFVETGASMQLWEQAQGKAYEAAVQLSVSEQNSYLHGEHFGDIGYYVGNVPAIPRLGLPALKMQDAAQGFRTTEPGTSGTTTAWPCLLALASTWDDDLVELVAAAIGTEFKGKGANIILGPSINVHRVAAGGRNFEYLSGEDPYLGARLTRAYVRGVQGQGVAAVAKHFAFNEQETHRMSMDAQVADRVKWELYYPPFKAAVEADVAAFMCAYNQVNGTYACHNADLLTSDLKQGMKFKGFVMSDWSATHGADALGAGLDQEQPGVIPPGIAGLAPEDAVLSDLVLEGVNKSIKDEAVTNILTTVFRLGLDQDPGCAPPSCQAELSTDQTKSVTRGDQHHSIALSAASSAVTLLKNEGGLLPLAADKAKKIAVLGNAAPNTAFFVGLGSGLVVPDSSAKAPLEAIKERAARDDIQVLAPKGSSLKEAAEIAEEADVVVVVAGALASEGLDRINLNLSPGSDSLIAAVASTKPTVVLMETPGAVLTPWRDGVASIANLFMGGVATGEAWAKFLFGDMPPRGRLPIMMPATAADVIPISLDSIVEYSEGLFTSYRSPHLTAAFPFGHGLSFTEFSYSNGRQVLTDCPLGSVCVAVDVTNTGMRDGEELVQAYAHFPEPAGGDEVWVKQTPEMFLKGYQHTKTMQPEDSQTLIFAFTADDLSLYSPGSGWVPQLKIEIRLGASSGDIRQTIAVKRSP